MRTYKRAKNGRFSSSGSSHGGKRSDTGPSKKKRKKTKKQSSQVANYRHTTRRALGDTSKEGNVSIERRGTRARVVPGKKVKKVGGKPSKGTKKDKRIKKNKKKK